MKKTQIKFLTLALFGLLMFGTFSCKDEFTEEDALKAQQQIDLTIYVVDKSTVDSKPVAGAKVTVSQGGATTEATTDDKGAAKFPKILVGGYVYTVTADNYTNASGSTEANPENYRQGQITQQVVLYSLTGDNVATIRGTATIETDVTNSTREAAANVKVFADVYLNNVGTKTFSATTDAQGNYEIKVPANAGDNGTLVVMRYSDIEAEQTIAVNRYSDETGDFFSFPQVLPRKEKVKTLFSTNTSFTLNRIFFGNNVRAVYATAEAPPSGGTQAIISAVYTNSKGEVTGIGFSSGGNYSEDADGIVNVTITSLDGGSGASIQIPLTGGYTSASAAYSGNSGSVVINKGSGYPINMNSFFDNRTLNKIDYRTPSSRNSFYVYPGTITVANVDYGTGVVRPRGIE